jgi:hypothetical protein
MGIVHYQYWHSMVLVLVLVFLHFGSVPVWAQSITGTGIHKWCLYWYWHFHTFVQYQYGHSPFLVLAFKKCPFWYWHFCTLIQYQYGHNPLPVLAFKNGARTVIGIFALWFSTSMGTVHYWYWHSKMVPVPVLAFLHFGSGPVWAQSITGTGIQKWCNTSIGIFALLFSTSMGIVHYWFWHSIVPIPVLAFLHFGSAQVRAHSITVTGI